MIWASHVMFLCHDLLILTINTPLIVELSIHEVFLIRFCYVWYTNGSYDEHATIIELNW
jgi:hypothetical protein